MKLHQIVKQIQDEKDYTKAIVLVKEAAEGNASFKRFLDIMYRGQTPFGRVSEWVVEEYDAPFQSKVRENALITWEEALVDLEREYSNSSTRAIHRRMGYLWNTLDIMDSQDADLFIRCLFRGDKVFDQSLLVLLYPGINDPKQ